MATWWITEVIPLAVTALLPIIALPLIGISVAIDERGRLGCAAAVCADPGVTPPQADRLLTLADLGASYSHPIVLLYIGGFLLGIAIERSGLSRRIALGIVGKAGDNPRLMLAGFIIAAGLISMWISNTSTSLILTPLAVSLAAGVGAGAGRLASSLILGIAWAATVGGLATPIGTPTNAIALSQLRIAGIEVSFLQWMSIGVPVVLILLPIAWLILSRGLNAESGASGDIRERVRSDIAELGPLSAWEIRTALVFCLTAGLWVSSSALSETFGPYLTGARIDPGHIDTMIATLAAVLFFIIPAGGGQDRALLTWSDTRALPWEILLLFGGGLALAAGAELSGLSAWLAHALDGVGGLHPALVILIIGLLVITITEFASNIATISIMGPVLLALAAGSSTLSAASFIIPAAMAASMGFAMPVGSGSNAIAYGTGLVPMKRMIRLGLVFNLCCLLVLTTLALTLFPQMLAH
jgi:sodium-dependent dicarboxylate transporter 2/3/5